MQFRRSLLVLVVLTVVAGAALAAAGDPVEAWRTPGGTPYALAINTTDHTGWAVLGTSVVHFASDSTILSETPGFATPESLSVNPTDGSVWVADSDHRQVVHLAADGSVLWRGGTFTHPASVSVNTADGSCWVADTRWNQIDGRVVHLAADGSEIWRSDSICFPLHVAVDPSDGSVWTVFGDVYQATWQLVHFAADGSGSTSAGSYGYPGALALDPQDGSVWLEDGPPGAGTASLVHVSKAGAELLRVPNQSARHISISPADGSLWIAGIDGVMPIALKHLSPTGEVLWQSSEDLNVTAFAWPNVDPSDGSVWDLEIGRVSYAGSVVRRTAAGQEIWRTQPLLSGPHAVAVDESDGSAWVSCLGGTVSHLDADGNVVKTVSGFQWVWTLVVNPADRTVWIGDRGAHQVVHLAADGSEIWRSGQVPDPGWLAVNPSDGSLWFVGFIGNVDELGNQDNGELVHMAADGTVLYDSRLYVTGTYPWNQSESIALDPRDGSVWLPEIMNHVITHLGADGTSLLTIPNPLYASDVAVNTTDGSVLLSGDGGAGLLAPDGTLLWRTPPITDPNNITFVLAQYGAVVNSLDGTAWAMEYPVSTLQHDELSPAGLIKFAPDGTILWRGGLFGGYGAMAVNSTDGSVWIVDRLNNQVVRYEQSDYSAGPFPDVAANYWAVDAIEAAVEAGLVTGYPGGNYGPEDVITRAQVAVFVSRAIAGGDANIPEPTGAASFADVPAGSWAWKYVEYAKANGLVEGYDDGYHPNVPVDRAQMAVFVSRAVADPVGDQAIKDYQAPSSPSFADVPADSWAYQYIEYAKAQGIVQGYWDGYHPQQAVTRAQMAVFMARAFDLLP